MDLNQVACSESMAVKIPIFLKWHIASDLERTQICGRHNFATT